MTRGSRVRWGDAAVRCSIALVVASAALVVVGGGTATAVGVHSTSGGHAAPAAYVPGGAGLIPLSSSVLAAAASYPLPPGPAPLPCTISQWGAWPTISERPAGVFDPTKPCYLTKPDGKAAITGPVGQTIRPGQTLSMGVAPSANGGTTEAFLLGWNNLFDFEPLMRGSTGQPANDISGYDTFFSIPPSLDDSGCYNPAGGYAGGRWVSTCNIYVQKGPYYGTPPGQPMPWTIFTASSQSNGVFQGLNDPFLTNDTGVPVWHGQFSYVELPVFLQPSPYAGIAAAPAGHSMQFTDATKSDLQITSWSWKFGDGTTSTQQSPLHTYPHPGTYSPSLTVTTIDGQTDTATTSIDVTQTNPTLSGKVTDLSGHGVQTTLTLTDTGNSTSQQLATDASGAYSVTVTDGNYRLDADSSVPASLFTPSSQSFPVTSDTTANLTFNGHLLGVGITSSSGLTLSGVPVTVTGSGTVLGGPTSSTNSVGTADFEVSPGTYTATPANPRPSQNNTFTPTSAQANLTTSDAVLLFAFNPALAVNQVSPNAGQVAGGDTVTISGGGFTDNGTPVVTKVRFVAPGGASFPAASFTVVNATTITAVTPNAVTALQKGRTTIVSDVRVSTAKATSPVGSGDKFTFGNVPVVTKVAPNEGPWTGASTVSVTGKHLTGATSVAFVLPDGSSVAGTVAPGGTDTRLTVTAPRIAATIALPAVADIIVTTKDGPSPAGANDRFTFRQLHVVQLGDSIASGEGINYLWTYSNITDTWTDANPHPTWDPPYQECHQSSLAYGDLVAATLHAAFTTFACTGGTYAAGVGGPEGTVPAQFGNSVATVNPAYVAAEPDVVLVSLGADDIQFSDIFAACIKNALANQATPAIPLQCTKANPGPTVTADYFGALPGIATHLTTLANHIKAVGKQAPGGIVPKIVFNDYYVPFPAQSSHTCLDTGNLDPNQLSYLRTLVLGLDTKIAGTVTTLAGASSNIGFVELKDVMAGHTWCSADPRVFGLSILATDIINALGINQSPFHPTVAGQQAIAGRVQTEANTLIGT